MSYFNCYYYYYTPLPINLFVLQCLGHCRNPCRNRLNRRPLNRRQTHSISVRTLFLFQYYNFAGLLTLFYQLQTVRICQQLYLRPVLIFIFISFSQCVFQMTVASLVKVSLCIFYPWLALRLGSTLCPY
jgi:hypothetical protein